MARMNVPVRQPPIATHEGAPAARATTEQQLRRSVMACLLWENTFYEDGVAIAERIEQLATVLPEEVVAAIALEARSEMHLRHAPLLLAKSLARRGASNTADTLAAVIQRADELTEFLAIYFGGPDRRTTKQKLSHGVRRGLTRALRKFNEYQLAKYDRPDGIKLRDFLRIVRPKPVTDEEAALWGRARRGELTTPDTWEVALSTGESKLNAWSRLLEEGKLGALALLRNLRNMTEAGVDKSLIRSAVLSANAERVLPFRFITAARYAPWLEPALEELMFRNLAEMPKLPGATVLLIDASGSMADPISDKSELRRYDAACGLAMLLREVCADVTIARFNNTVASVPPRRGFALRDALGHPSGGTYTEIAKTWADKHGYDRLVIITDEQSAQRVSAPKFGQYNYILNVAAYQNGIGYRGWVHIDGWSEAVVTYIQQLEALDAQRSAES